MTRWRCKSCNATYDDDQPGGFYHACAEGTENSRDENWMYTSELIKTMTAQGERVEYKRIAKKLGFGRVKLDK